MLPRIVCLLDETCHLSLLAPMAEAGVTGFQVRSKTLGGRDLVGLTRAVIAAVRPSGATVDVDDRLDVALAAGADGVHLGAADLATSDARRVAPHLRIGTTCRSREDVEAAAAAGADHAGFGPVFESRSKDDLPAPLGLGAVARASGILPLLAIGGIDASRARDVLDAGADGIAVIGAVWRHPDPVAAAKELVTAVG